jgi:hypothetical protein
MSAKRINNIKGVVMKKSLPLMLIGLICGVLCTHCRDEITDSSYLYDECGMDHEEYTILSVILDSLYSHKQSSEIYVADSTSAMGFGNSTSEELDQRIVYIQEKIENVNPSTLQDFKYKNLKPSRINNHFNAHLPCVISDKSKIYGKVTMSRVGFNRNHTQACAYAGILYAPLAGAGSYYILSYTRGSWKITNSLLAWIS